MAEKLRIFNSVEDIYKLLDEGVPVSQKYGYSHPTKTAGESIRLSLGRIWFNMLMPSSFPLVNEPVSGKMCSALIKKISEEFSPEEASDYVTKLNQETFRISSYCPTTFSLESLILDDEVKDMKEELREKVDGKDPREWEKKVGEVADEIKKKLEKDNERIMNIPTSGAKDLPLDKLMVAQGYVADIEGVVHGPIRTAISDGNQPEDYYASAAEARRGFYKYNKIKSKDNYEEIHILKFLKFLGLQIIPPNLKMI